MSTSFWRDEPAEHHLRVLMGCLRAAVDASSRAAARAAAESLVRFHVHALAEKMPPDDLAARVDEIHRALGPAAESLRRWGNWATGNAQNGREDEQFESCVARSALALLLRDHAQHLAIARMQEEIDELDEELIRMLESYGPVAERSRPSPIPPGHWWWTERGRFAGPTDQFDVGPGEAV